MIICCGEALIDMVPEMLANGESSYVPRSGGAVFNTAIAMGRLGIECALVSGVSNDLFGEQLVQGLEHSNVTTDHLRRSELPTTLAFVKLVNGHASYAFYDENTAGRMLTQADAVTLPKEAHALYFGGISLATLPCQEFYLETLARNSEGRVVMIDPNIRPAFIADEMQYRAVLTDAFERVDIVKVSDEDLDWIDQSDASLEEKARTLLGRGPSVVIITRGGDGALIYLTGSDAPVIVAAQKVTVADTVGAGDSFNAGFLANLEDNGLLSPEKIANLSADQAREAAQFAASVAAITVTRQGANPPWRDELTA